jgi:flavin-dependent dehydrogenase
MFKNHLLASEEAASVRYGTGKRVHDVKFDGGERVPVVSMVYEDVEMKNSKIAEADLVIAVDGARSAVGKIVIPDSALRYARYIT